MAFEQPQAQKIEALIHELESETRAEILVSVVDQSSGYPQLFWMSYSLLLVLLLLIVFLLDAYTIYPLSIEQGVICILGISLPLAQIFSILKLRFKFLSLTLKRRKTLQKAREIALEEGVFSLPEKNGILFFLSQAEKTSALLVDQAFKKIPWDEWHRIRDQVEEVFKKEGQFKAVTHGISEIKKTLLTHGFKLVGKKDNLLPNQPHHQTNDS